MVLLAAGGEGVCAETPPPGGNSAGNREASRLALGKLNGLVGGWRGVGQPVRNSNRGAWVETAEWVWEIKPEELALRYQVAQGKIFTSARLTYDPQRKRYVLRAALPDKSQRHYSGQFREGKLVLESAPDGAGLIHLVSISPLNEKRAVVLFQKRSRDSEHSDRVAEVGYTRQGTRLAEEGAGGAECIVTGGKGTMTVTYKGRTYYVCCTGCRDAFLADPEGILAEAARRDAQKKANAAPAKP